MQPPTSGRPASNKEDEEDDLEDRDLDNILEEDNLEGPGTKFNLQPGHQPVQKNKSNPNIPDYELKNLAENIAIMNVSGSGHPKKLFLIDKQFPFIMYDYMNEGQCYVSVDFLICGTSKSNICLQVDSSGMSLLLNIVVPLQFICEDQLLKVNNENLTFNNNTHKPTAFMQCVEKIFSVEKVFSQDCNGNVDHPILGELQVVALPFKCEQDIVEWEIQGNETEDEDFTNDSGSISLIIFFLLDW